MYFIGGALYDGTTGFTNNIYYATITEFPENVHWLQAEIPDHIPVRTKSHLIAVEDPANSKNNYLVMFGGESMDVMGQRHYLGDAWLYLPVDNSWTNYFSNPEMNFIPSSNAAYTFYEECPVSTENITERHCETNSPQPQLTSEKACHRACCA